MELPIPPDFTSWFVTMIILTIIGGIASIILVNKSEKLKITGKREIVAFTPLFAIVILIINVGYISSVDQNIYRTQMVEIIETVECKELPSIAHERVYFRERVVDEVVLRCLINSDNTELVSFLMEAKG